MFSPSTKYRPFPSVALPDRQWPGRVLSHAPIWCSVDLRDGNQALAVPMNLAQKLEMFEALVRCGFKEIEVGFPAASNTEFAFNRRLISEGRIPDDVTVQVLVQAREDLIERTVESLVGAKKCIIHLYNSTSPAQRRVVFGKSKGEIVEMAVRGARWIKERMGRLEEAGGNVRLQYSPESFSATEVEFAREIAEAVMEVWEPTPAKPMILNLPDTVEVAMPNVYADQIEWICRNIRNRDSLIVSLHTHNDRGTGVAATELGLLAGADRVEGTLFGNGERTGNLDIVIVALNLYMHGIDPGLDFSNMGELVKMYQKCTAMEVPKRQPYSGELVFTAFSGSHQDAIRKGFAEWEKNAGRQHWDVPYLTIDPKDIGRNYEEVIRVNSQSGKGGVAYLVEQALGLELPKDLQREFGPIANDYVEGLGREVTPAELLAFFEEEYERAAAPWSLGDSVQSAHAGRAKFEGNVVSFGESVPIRGEGSGALEAFADALNGVFDPGMPRFTLVGSHTSTLESATPARTAAFAHIRFGQEQSSFGFARDENEAQASLRALLCAVNRAYPWVMFERATGITLPGPLRQEFGRMVQGLMQGSQRRWKGAELAEVFFEEYRRAGRDRATGEFDVLSRKNSFDVVTGAHACEIQAKLADGAVRQAEGRGTTESNAYCAALAAALQVKAEVVDSAETRAHPTDGRRASDFVAFVKLRVGSGELLWGVGLGARYSDAVAGAVTAAAARLVGGRGIVAAGGAETFRKAHPFPFDVFEPKWQRHWDEAQTFRTPNPGEPGFDPARPKYYVLDMFPYPSGAGLHVGHPEGYTATDIIGRYKTMRGWNVLHPMGWDAFGLPAEQYAIRTGQHPETTTAQNVAHFKAQLKRLGFAYDWSREINTTDPEYFRWTQWIFLQIYHSWLNPETKRAEPISTFTGADPDSVRLAYVSDAPVNWCPALGTVLANEEVIDGRSEVGGHPVERRQMKQWMLRITSYAQRLIDDLQGLDWPEPIRNLQRNWIGRSEGAMVFFEVAGKSAKLPVYTTRPDTLFGATYLVLAPEHPLVEELTVPEARAQVAAYRESCARKSDLERTDLAKEKSGVFTGSYAINPANAERVPIWIADYVLMGYGTGAIMAVPAHDARDLEFARAFDLPIRQVVAPPDMATDWLGYVGEGTAIQSGFLEGLPTATAAEQMIVWLEGQGMGRRTVQYKLRDWLFSRQRYWGEPFPIVWEGGRHRGLAETQLPLVPPKLADFKPTGSPEPPLSKAAEWVRYSATARRELNTMPQWAGSCWYYLRYTDPRNGERFAGREAEEYWMGGGKPGGVDLYVGGTEHAVLHLLYARFWHKVLHDLGHVSTPEPFQRLVNQGLILGETEFTLFESADGRPCSTAELRGIEEEVTHAGPRLVGTHVATGEKATGRRIAAEEVEQAHGGSVLKRDPSIRVDARSFKMSKSRGNVINPDEVIQRYGADALRCYEMFMGPLEATKPWSMTGVEGVFRFLARVWRLAMEETEAGAWALSAGVAEAPIEPALAKVMHFTIRKVTEDIESLSFNTAIAQMMVFVKALTGAPVKPRGALRTLLILLNPFAPHLTEELWERLGCAAQEGPISRQCWPEHDSALLVEEEIEISVQVNGKVRGVIRVGKDASQEEVKAAALSAKTVEAHLAGAEVKKVIVVPGRTVNIVLAR